MSILRPKQLKNHIIPFGAAGTYIALTTSGKISKRASKFLLAENVLFVMYGQNIAQFCHLNGGTKRLPDLTEFRVWEDKYDLLDFRIYLSLRHGKEGQKVNLIHKNVTRLNIICRLNKCLRLFDQPFFFSSKKTVEEKKSFCCCC